MTAVPVRVQAWSIGSRSRVSVFDTLGDTRPRRGLPSAIEAGQAYYWSAQWQTDEAESVHELERGEGRCFDSIEDALAWLRSPED